MDANNDGKIEFDEFISILGVFDQNTILDYFKTIVVEID